MDHKFTARAGALRRHRVRIRSYRPGAAPGTLGVPAADGEAATAPARISLLRYGGGGFVRETTPEALGEDCAPTAARGQLTWLHLQGLPNAEQLERLGALFDLHALALEDVFNRERRPKLESYPKQLFIILGLVHRDANDGFTIDQVSFFLGPDYVISINESQRDVFEPVRQRIRGGGKICALGTDYLLYALMDLVVDSGFPLLEQLGDELEALEDEILNDPNPHARNRLHYVKRELMLMRRAWWPQREVVASLMRQGDGFLVDGTLPYLRDCHEHCVIVIDFVETYREMAASLLDTYLSAVSQRMNDIMKALTIVATIFLPLMFITGLYGMNFDTTSPWNLPELHWRFGYVYVLCVMAAIASGMILYFRRKRWL